MAKAFRSMWPQESVHDEEGYLSGLAAFLMTLPSQQAKGLLNPTGFVVHHKFPPTIAEIHAWTKRFQPRRDYNHGPNFTRERLEREAYHRRIEGPPPKPEKTADEKAAMIDKLIGTQWRGKTFT